MEDEHKPSGEDRWDDLLPETDPCEHRYLRITSEGVCCCACDEDLGRAIYRYFRQG